jgi:hypothetical protein
MTTNLNLALGDRVIYTQEAHDHDDQRDMQGTRRLEVGEEYTIVEMSGTHGTILGFYSDSDETWEPGERVEEICLEGTEWWIPISCVTPVEALQLGEHWRVIRKIKQIDATRKLLGYKY